MEILQGKAFQNDIRLTRDSSSCGRQNDRIFEGGSSFVIPSVCEESQSVYIYSEIFRGTFVPSGIVMSFRLCKGVLANRHFCSVRKGKLYETGVGLGVLVCSGSSGSFFESLYVDVL